MSPRPRLLLVLCTIPVAERIVALNVNPVTGSNAKEQGVLDENRKSFTTFIRDLKHRVAIFYTKGA